MSTTAAIPVWSHPVCLDHLPALGHPETPGRLRILLQTLRDTRGPWALDPEREPAAEGDALGAVKWLHEPAYIERFRTTVERSPALLDGPDNPVGERTFRAAVGAAGLAVRAALDLANGRLKRAFLALRPPGHHALPDRAMGFCFFNNAAVAAELFSRAWQAPVLVVDFDVHHGNGTQFMFYDRADVAYLSVHRYPFYPGTGAADEAGTGAGLGTTRNLPLAAGAGDDLFASALETGLEELAARLKPALIVVSAGFDAHVEDPLGGMAVTEAGFRRMGRAIAQAADAFSGGRVLSLLEGGYHPQALGRSVAAYLEGLAGETPAGEVN